MPGVSGRSFIILRGVFHEGVYFATLKDIDGENDYNTPAKLIQAYVETLEAPHGKELILMDDVAHTPFLGNPDGFRDAVLHVKQWQAERE